MNAGDFDRLVRIMHAPLIDDGTATVRGPLTLLARRYAKRIDVSDSERFRAQELGSAVTTRFVMRWDTVTATIGGNHVLVCDGVTYAVTGAKDSLGRRDRREITAVARTDMVIAP